MVGPDDLEDDGIDGVGDGGEEDGDNGLEAEASDGQGQAPEAELETGDESLEGQQVAPQPRPIGRAERAVLEAKRAAKEAREEAERTRRELDEFRRQQTERVNPAEQEARLAAMDPEERINYRIDQAQQANTKALRNLELSFKEQADKATFEVTLAQQPSLKKYEGKVEAIYAEHMANAKRNGTAPPDRATILPWVIGQEVLKSSAKAVDKGRKAGAANIARQTTRPVSTRGDVSASGGRGKSLAEKLADVTF